MSGIDWGLLSSTQLPESKIAPMPGGVLAQFNDQVAKWPQQSLIGAQRELTKAEQAKTNQESAQIAQNMGFAGQEEPLKLGGMQADMESKQAGTAQTLQNTKFGALEEPTKLAGLQTDVASKQQDMSIKGQEEPLKMQGLALGNQSQSIANSQGQQGLQASQLEFNMKKQSYVNDQLASLAFADPSAKPAMYQQLRQQAMQVDPKYTQQAFPDEQYTPTEPDGSNKQIDSNIHAKLIQGMGVADYYGKQLEMMRPQSDAGKQALDAARGYDVAGATQQQAVAKAKADDNVKYITDLNTMSSTNAQMGSVLDQMKGAYNALTPRARGPLGGQAPASALTIGAIAGVTGKDDASNAQVLDQGNKQISELKTAILKDSGVTARLSPAVLQELGSAAPNRQLTPEAFNRQTDMMSNLIKMQQTHISYVNAAVKNGVTDRQQLDAGWNDYVKSHPVSDTQLQSGNIDSSEDIQKWAQPDNIQKIMGGQSLGTSSQSSKIISPMDLQTTYQSAIKNGFKGSLNDMNNLLESKGYKVQTQDDNTQAMGVRD